MSKDRRYELTTKQKEWLRAFLAERDGWVCHICGYALLPDNKWRDPEYWATTTRAQREQYREPTIDHIIPLVKLTKEQASWKNVDNFKLACRSCNCRKRAS